MKIKRTDTELRALFREHLKQKVKFAFKKYCSCSFQNRFCDDCKESKICEKVFQKSWIPIGKL